MKFLTQFSVDRPSPGVDCQTKRDVDLGAKQEFRDECDINRIMDRYNRTGQLPDLVSREPMYGDFSEVPTYLEAVELVERAETAFMALPAEVRAECANDPAVFLDRVRDREWAEKHKLVLPSSTPALQAAEGSGAAGQAAGGKGGEKPPGPSKSGKSDAE